MLKAEYIAHMDSFRIYDDKRPEWTMVYADDLEEVEQIEENPRLMRLFIFAIKMSNEELDKLIEGLK